MKIRVSVQLNCRSSTLYLYCSNSSLWVMINCVFLLVKTRFPRIRPKTSGLQKQKTGVKQRRKTLVSQNTVQTVRILASLPGYSQHKTSDHALHAALWNVLKKLPANSLPYHVCAGARRQPRSHHSQNEACIQKDGKRFIRYYREKKITHGLKVCMITSEAILTETKSKQTKQPMFNLLSLLHKMLCNLVQLIFYHKAQNSPLWPWMHTLPST